MESQDGVQNPDHSGTEPTYYRPFKIQTRPFLDPHLYFVFPQSKINSIVAINRSKGKNRDLKHFLLIFGKIVTRK